MINKEMLKNLKYFEKTPLIHHINYSLTEDAKKYTKRLVTCMYGR